MKLSDTFWKKYELDLQEVKVAYLNWALDHAKEPTSKHRHLFLWDHQESFHIVNSRYGRAFSGSPFGIGVHGVTRLEINGEPPGIDSWDINLKKRLSSNTNLIREAIKDCLVRGNIQQARDTVLNFYWLKLTPHELLFDNVQYGEDDTGRIRKGRWGLDESERWWTLRGIRNRIINVVRFGEDLEDDYVRNLNKRLPGFSRNSHSTFLSSAMTWNKYAMCAFDCGPVLWIKRGSVNFSIVKERMSKLGWPYKSTAREILKPYHIALDYRRPPIRLRKEPDEGYSLKSMRRRRCQLYEILDNILNEINRIRDGNMSGYT